MYGVGTLGDQEEVSVQVDQLLGRLLPEHLFLVPCAGLPELRRSLHNHVVQLDRLLYLWNIPVDRFQIFHITWDTRDTLVCLGTLVFRCRWTITEEIIAQHGNNFPFGPSLDVSCVSNGDHFDVSIRTL